MNPIERPSAKRLSAEWLAGEDSESRERAAELLKAGECVVLPTETVYGLAADARNPQAVAKIFAAKGRPADHPLIVHLAEPQQMTDWCSDIPDIAWLLAEVFWPGPLTLLLKKRPEVPAEVTGGLETLCVRVPEHPVFLDVLKRCNSGLAAPSANPYKSLSPTTAEQVMQTLGTRVAAVVDGGRCDEGIESTILDLTDIARGLRILRTGPVSQTDIERATGLALLQTEEHQIAVPGNVKAHYQPSTPLQLITADELASLAETDSGRLFLVWSPQAVAASVGLPAVRVMPDVPARYAYELYHTLYMADMEGHRELCIECPPQTERWQAVNDRLRRAAAR